MSVWRSLEGQMEAVLLTADPANALDAMAQAQIPVAQVRQDEELTVSFRIRRGDFRKLAELSQRRGEKLSIRRRIGLYYLLQSLFGRRILMAGVLLLFAFTLLLPTRILFFRVEGNEEVPTLRILEEAERLGLRFGVSRRGIRSEKIKNGLLGAIPELKWAGVNTYGCVAQITVAEKQAEQAPDRERAGIGHLVSALDGIVTDVTVTRGTALCRPGQAVQKGQILISGLMDCGIIQKGTAAQGEVNAVTRHELSAVTPEKRFIRQPNRGRKTRWSLLIGKKRINLWIGSRIWDARCGRIYKEHSLTLPGGFRLPIKLASDEWTQGGLREDSLSAAEAKTQLSCAADAYLRGGMLAGLVRQKQEELTKIDGRFLLTGKYLCREVISRRQWEQIGDQNE